MLKKTEKRKEVERVTPRHMLRTFDEMDRVFDRMFEEFFPRGWMRPFHFGRGSWPGDAFEGRTPRIDLIDREDDVLVRAELPGVDKKDLDISLTEDTVTIEAKSHHEEQEEEERYYRHEITRGEFSRTLPLPCRVKGDEAKAHFEDGVLELTLPKVEKTERLTVKVE